MEKYAWTASHFMELIIEVVFGVSYNASKKEIVISPNLSHELESSRLAIEGLKISSDVSLDLVIDKGEISYTVSDCGVKVICL